MSEASQDYWRRCSSCKTPIAFGAKHYVCSVSTCNGQRTGYVFCSVLCFERHLPGARHRDAAAIEAQAPSRASASGAPVSATASPPEGVKRIVAKGPGGGSSPSVNPKSAQAGAASREILVIASRFKDFIHARSGFNTSQAVMDILSDHLRVVAERAIDNARADGRKTVMERDFSFLKSN